MASLRTTPACADQHNLSLSAGYSSHRSSRATLRLDGAEFTEEGLESLLVESSPGGRALPIDVLTQAIRRTNLPPLLIVHEPETKLLGRGSQFVVYKSIIHDGHHNPPARKDIAIKTPIYPLDPNISLSLASPDVQKHLHDVYLEILALTNPTIHDHPNIVQLLGWGTDLFNFHRHLYLVTELAYANLREFFRMHGNDATVLPVSQRNYEFCNDIAAGLDVIHECGLIHGDLKPDNILMFPRGDGTFVAKLADFGLSISEASANPSQAKLGGTVGWQAPEVEGNRYISKDYFLQTDSFSFGLLVWSIMLHDGKTTPIGREQSRRSIALSEVDEAEDFLGNVLHRIIRKALDELLDDEPFNRPTELELLLYCWEDPENYLSGLFEQISVSSDSDMTEFVEDYKGKVFDWEPHMIHDSLFHSWVNRFKQSPESVPVESLFGLFLVCTEDFVEGNMERNTFQDILECAAARGSESARGIISTVLRHIGITVGEELQSRIHVWLKTAATTGSTLAKKELETTDPVSVPICVERFRDMGGYARHYCRIDPSEIALAKGHIAPSRYSHLHWLATFGSSKQLTDYLDSSSSYEIDAMTDDKETPLYLACARGSWKVVAALLDRGANPSVQCTEFNISCLHWLFAFDSDQLDTVLSRLLACGADLNAMSAPKTPFRHYPFVLPSGTALHWAVVVGAHNAIEALIRQGADLYIRDGSDPYVADRRVREQMFFGGPNIMGAYSKPSVTVQGLSPLDYAAMRHDPFIFQYLFQEDIPVDINAVDEEGLSVLHRISAYPRRETRNQHPFSDLVFRGTEREIEENLKRSITAIKLLGGDLDLRTNGIPDRVDFPDLTPLMMAAKGTMPSIVRELAASGTDLDTENVLGQTALMSVSEDKQTATEVCRTLVEFGANVNHCDKYGNSPIIIVAVNKLLDIVDLLLSKGVDITETYAKSREKAMERGSSLFSLLACTDRPFQDDNDVAIEKLLEKHVFSCPNVSKRRQVLGCTGVKGWSLMHSFALMAMPRCVRALVSNGAPINATRYVGTKNYDMDVIKDELQYETPLDVIIDRKRRKLDEMRRRSEFSPQENENLLQRMDTVIAILKSAGGITISHDIDQEVIPRMSNQENSQENSQ